MAKPSIAIKLSARDYSGLANLANRVSVSLLGNLNFPNPTPAISVLDTAATDLVNAIAVYGNVHNRGSKEALLDLRAKAVVAKSLLVAEAAYVVNTAELACGNDYTLMAAIIASSGFSLKKAPGTPQGLPQPVENFHRLVSLSLDQNRCKLKWKQPLNITSKDNVKCYLVFRGTTNVLSAATQIATVSRTEFIDTNSTGAVVTYYYWIIAVGAAGNGAASSSLSVTLLSM